MNNTLFENMNLSPEVIQALGEMGYIEPTPIQSQAIPYILEGRDVIGRSATGTGKTAAFGLPAIEMLENTGKPQVLVICPTRELAIQISDEIKKYAKHKNNVRTALIYGGQAMDRQIFQLKSANIVIGTPGRLMDHMRRRTLKLETLKMVILDEADEMLKMGFYEDIQLILSQVPEERQTVLFSATMPPEIMKITQEFQTNPAIVSVESVSRTTATIEQFYYKVPRESKMDSINLLLQYNNPKRAVIFCNTKKMVDDLVEYLSESGFKATGLHGDMKQVTRSHVMNEFKRGRINTLVATDVCARGIDVEDIEAVFNYDIPQEFEYYIHRIGRTGRAGKTGRAFTLVSSSKQVGVIRSIEKYIKAPIKESTLPTAVDIVNQNKQQVADNVKKSIEKGNQEEYQYVVDLLLEEGYDLNYIAGSLVAIIAGRDKKNIPHVKVAETNRPRRERRGNEGGAGRKTVRLSLGKKHGVATNHIVGAITEDTGLPGRAIGKITINNEYSDIELNGEDAMVVIDCMADCKIRKMKAKITLLSGAPAGGGGFNKRRPKTGKPADKDFNPSNSGKPSEKRGKNNFSKKQKSKVSQ